MDLADHFFRTDACDKIGTLTHRKRGNSYMHTDKHSHACTHTRILTVLNRHIFAGVGGLGSRRPCQPELVCDSLTYSG